MNLKTIKEIINDETKPSPSIVGGGILNDSNLLLIIGRPKSGKSFLAMNFGLGIAAGRSFSGFEIIQPRKVMMLSAEGGYYQNRKRLLKMHESINAEADIPLHISSLSYFPINESPNHEELVDIIDKLRPDVLIIDPFIKFHSVDENTSSQIMEVLGSLRSIIDDFSTSIILVHHTGKNESRGGRGSNAIEGEYDSSISIKRDRGRPETRLSFDLRHEESPSPREVYFNSRTNWFEMKTSLIVEALVKNGPLTRNELVQYLIENHDVASSTAYYHISNEEANGQIQLDQSNSTYTPSSLVIFDK